MIQSGCSLFFLVFFTLPLISLILIAAWVIHPAIAILLIMVLGGVIQYATSSPIDNENEYY